jgi:hypothetical protein
MHIGRFFSLSNGRVGQYLSPRVLVVRKPFHQPQCEDEYETCYFAFDKLTNAQTFMQYLIGLGYAVQLHVQHPWLSSRFTVQLQGHADQAQVLAYWERLSYQSKSVKPTDTTRTVIPFPKPDRTLAMLAAV